MIGGAGFDGPYRYRLWRVLSEEPGPTWLYVMLNPSTADASLDDQTIRRCSFFARREGVSRFEVVNLYALCSTYPSLLLHHEDPIGPLNDEAIDNAVADADRVVVAWGAVARPFRGRAYDVLDRLHERGDVWCLGWTETLWPRHPSRLPNKAELCRVQPSGFEASRSLLRGR